MKFLIKLYYKWNVVNVPSVPLYYCDFITFIFKRGVYEMYGHPLGPIL